MAEAAATTFALQLRRNKRVIWTGEVIRRDFSVMMWLRSANKRWKRRKGCKCALLGRARWVVVVVGGWLAEPADEAMTAPHNPPNRPSGSHRLICDSLN